MSLNLAGADDGASLPTSPAQDLASAGQAISGQFTAAPSMTAAPALPSASLQQPAAPTIPTMQVPSMNQSAPFIPGIPGIAMPAAPGGLPPQFGAPSSPMFTGMTQSTPGQFSGGQQGTFSLMSSVSGFGGTDGVGATLQLEFSKRVKALKEGGQSPFNISTILIPKSEIVQLYYSCIAVLVSDNTGVAGVQVLMLEGSGAPMATESRNDGMGGQISIRHVPGDAWDADAVNLIKPRVMAAAASMGVAPEGVRLCDGQVVFTGFQVDDAAAVSALLTSSVLAARSMLPSAADQPNYTLTALSGTETLSVDVTMNNPPILPADGNPRAATALMALNTRSRNSNDNGQNSQRSVRQFNGQNSQAQVGLVGAYIDVAYAPPQIGFGGSPYYPMGMQDPNNRRHWLARVTASSAMTRMPSGSPRWMWLSIATLLALKPNYAWLDLFSAPHVQSGISAQDPGVLTMGIDGQGEPEMWLSAAIDRQQLGQNLMRTILPDPVFAIEHRPTSADSWLTSTFGLAARGNPEARALLIKEANLLTNGHLERIAASQGMQQIPDPVIITNEWRWGGYYHDAAGQKQSLSTVGAIAVGNTLGRFDRGAMAAWARATNPNETSGEARQLSEQARIIEAALGGLSVQMNHRVQICTLGPKFLDLFMAAIAACGQEIRLNVGQQGVGQHLQMPNAWSYYQAAASQGAGVLPFNYGGAAMPMQMGTTNRFQFAV